MNVEEARVHVKAALGPSWELSFVVSTLVPGPSLGSPTQQRVEVQLDYHPGGRAEGTGWVTGPHLMFQGTAESIEAALAIATGDGLRHPSVQLLGSDVLHPGLENGR